MRKTCLGEPFNNNKRWRSGQQKVVKLCANPASGSQSGCHLAAKSPSAALSATAFTLAQLKPARAGGMGAFKLSRAMTVLPAAERKY
jgi:hypothetical protein